MTRLEKIHAMNAEQMADAIHTQCGDLMDRICSEMCGSYDSPCPYIEAKYGMDCKRCVVDWLNGGVEDDH